MKLKDFVRKFRWGAMLPAILSVAMGILLIAVPEGAAVALVVSSGVLLLIAGIVSVIVFLAGHSAGARELVAGVAEITIALWCFIAPHSALRVLMLAFGILLLVRAFAGAGDAVVAKRQGDKLWGGMLAAAIAFAALAVVVLVNPFGSLRVLSVVTGVILIADGVAELIILVRKYRRIRAAKKSVRRVYERSRMTEVEEDPPREEGAEE